MMMRKFPVVFLLLLFVILLIGSVRPSQAEDVADLLLRNGRFYPVAPAEPVLGSLAVVDGKIAFLGPDKEAATWLGETTKVIDLGGRAVTPGLIDAHAHLQGLGKALSEVDLVGTGSFADVIELARQAAAELEPGAWVRGRGWDQNDWSEHAFPTHDKLSAAIPDHPVWLTRVDGHAVLVNRSAMESLGIDADTPNPEGGLIIRSDDGQATGVLIDEAKSQAARRLPKSSVAELERRILTAIDHCLARGLTTVTDMGVGADTIRAYESLADQGRLNLRAALFLEDDEELLESWYARGPKIDRDSRLLIRGIKLYADGALGSRGAALIEPYADDSGNLGLMQMNQERLETVCGRAVESGFQVGVHAIGDRANQMVLDGFENCLPRGHGTNQRFRIEHAQIMRVEDIARMTRLGVIAAMQPTHATSDMPWAEARVGAGRLAGAYAWQKVLDLGGRLALGSDAPVERIDPRLGLYAAVTRQDLDGEPPGGWLPDERLSREEALRGFTLDAAYSLFLDSEVGTIEVGKRADLVIFSRDMMTVPESDLPAVEIDMTLIDGEIVFQREAP